MDNGVAIELISEYNDWVAQKRISGADVTPEQFMMERAQSTALERLISISEYMEARDAEGLEPDGDHIWELLNG